MPVSIQIRPLISQREALLQL